MGMPPLAQVHCTIADLYREHNLNLLKYVNRLMAGNSRSYK